jgi:DNA-binding transcriptional ArsR family regulator
MVQSCRCRPESRERLRQVLEPDLFKALADPNRATLVARLGEAGESATVTEASDCCPVDMSVVSRHLQTLRSAGIVTATKQGREVRYRVEHRALAARLREIADALEQCCPPDCC